LCCSLELALQQPLTAEQYRDSLGRALAQAERVSWLAMGMRELFDAGQVGEGGEVLNLPAVVESVIDDIRLVAREAGTQITLMPGPPCPIWFEAQHLRNGLFHLLGFAVGSGVALIQVDLAQAGKEIMLTVTTSGVQPTTHSPAPDSCSEGSCSEEDDRHRDLMRRLGLGIARSIFEAAGGTFETAGSRSGISVQVRLPRADDRILLKDVTARLEL
jgi:hypothetical protein